MEALTFLRAEHDSVLEMLEALDVAAASGGAEVPHPATPPVGVVQKTMGLGVAVADQVRDAVTGRHAHTPPDPQSR
jgi:hypothetical protein